MAIDMRSFILSPRGIVLRNKRWEDWVSGMSDAEKAAMSDRLDMFKEMFFSGYETGVADTYLRQISVGEDGPLN